MKKRKINNVILATALVLGVGTITSLITSCELPDSGTLPTSKKLSLRIKEQPTKLTYKVNETLDLSGLKVELYDEETKVATDYTSFKTNPVNGYKFLESDISTDANKFKVVVSTTEDKEIKSTSFELTVEEAAKEFVNTTPYEFLTKLSDTGKYTVTSYEAKGDKEYKYFGTFIENATYWKMNTADDDCGYAQNDDQIIFYTISGSEIIKNDEYDRSKYESMYSDLFLEESNAIGYPINGVNLIKQSSFDAYKNLKRRGNTNYFNLPYSSDDNSTRIRDIIQLTQPTQTIMTDKYLSNDLGTDASFEFEMLSDTKMAFTIRATQTIGGIPLYSVIELKEDASIPEINDFITNVQDPEKIRINQLVKDTLLKNNFSIYNADGLSSVWTENYAYFEEKNSSGSALNSIRFNQKFKIGDKTYDAGSYRFTLDDKANLGDVVETGDSTWISPFLSGRELFTHFEKYFVYSKGEKDIFTSNLNDSKAPFRVDLPDIYTLFLGKAVADKPSSVAHIQLDVKFKDIDKLAVESIDVEFKINDTSASEKVTLKDFGTSKVQEVEDLIKSVEFVGGENEK